MKLKTTAALALLIAQFGWAQAESIYAPKQGERLSELLMREQLLPGSATNSEGQTLQLGSMLLKRAELYNKQALQKTQLITLLGMQPAGKVPAYLKPLVESLPTTGRQLLPTQDGHEMAAKARLDPVLQAGDRLAVPTTLFLDGLDATVAQAFERTLATLRRAAPGLPAPQCDLIETMRFEPDSGIALLELHPVGPAEQRLGELNAVAVAVVAAVQCAGIRTDLGVVPVGVRCKSDLRQQPRAALDHLLLPGLVLRARSGELRVVGECIAIHLHQVGGQCATGKNACDTDCQDSLHRVLRS